MKKMTGLIKTTLFGGIVLSLASCSALYRNHGYVPTPTELSEVSVGSDTRATVEEQIGHPTASGLLESGNWYYVQSRFRHFAYQEPIEISREVLAISFDSQNRVSNIERFGLEQGRVVVLSRRVTSSPVRHGSILRRLFGNIGGPDAGGFLGG